MAAGLKETKGFETLFAASQSSIQSRTDAIVCFIHAYLTSNHLVCVGVNDQEVCKTELLPKGWRDNQDVYVLRYLHEGDAEAFTLKVVMMDGVMMVHFMRRSDEAVTTTNVRPADYTNESVSDFHGTYKDLRDLEVQLRDEILRPMMGGPGRGPVPPQYHPAPPPQYHRAPPPQRYDDDSDPLRIGPVRHPPMARPRGLDHDDSFAVGRGDLDPLNAGVGGGMLMDPFRHGPVRGDPSAGLPHRLPPGAVPPGARFDPFGPPGIGPGGPNRFGPDPDHMRPPDYDNMFM